MPRYDYECTNCHHEFEVRQSFSSEPVATCPVCQNSARRVFRAVPIVFKGSGWYVNDYGKGHSTSDSKDGSKESESEKSSESKSEKKSSSSSDSKSKKEPAAKK